ncbi:HpcH/HpaI aldolase/citrate lyase family protein [Sphingobium sp. B2]|uniref:HpcH/HpaI aldolase/citrate lyase family protein n=1 Tax=Sphingobium sp. B2 TaxID=2583228 RepID=UPI0021BDAE9B|nr:CoA ester lyase [Sphingobium sp. B2]
MISPELDSGSLKAAPMRSLLFVPADRPDRFEKAVGSGADALILDFEDSVALSAKAKGRDAVTEWLGTRPGVTTFVRVNPLDSPFIADDIAAVVAARPNGVVLPKAKDAQDVRRLKALLEGADIPILPIACETPSAVFGLGTYEEVGSNLAGLTWGAEDLPAAMGASSAREPDGSYTDPYRIVRALVLFAAHAASVPAIETVFPAIRDLKGLASYVERARRDGFTAMMAIHPAQVKIINEGFSPTATEIEEARRIIDAFESNPDAGVLQVQGKMLDLPHLKLAKRILRLVHIETES